MHKLFYSKRDHCILIKQEWYDKHWTHCLKLLKLQLYYKEKLRKVGGLSSRFLVVECPLRFVVIKELFIQVAIKNEEV